MIAALLLSLSLITSPILHQIETHSAIIWADIKVTTPQGVQDVGETDTCSAVQVAVNDAKATDLTLVTAGHCVHDTNENEMGTSITVHPTLTHVQFFDGDLGKVESVTVFPKDDAAFIHVHTQRSHPMPTIYGNGPRRGEKMFVFGDPQSSAWSLQDAMSMQGPVFNGLYDPWKFTYAIECSACAPGDSGAGVWNAQGHLLGIVVAGDGQSTLIVPMSRLGK